MMISKDIKLITSRVRLSKRRKYNGKKKTEPDPMNKNVEERILHPKSGMAMLFLLILGIVGSIVLMILSGAVISEISSVLSGFCVTVGILILCTASVCLAGLKVINPMKRLCWLCSENITEP